MSKTTGIASHFGILSDLEFLHELAQVVPIALEGVGDLVGHLRRAEFH